MPAPFKTSINLFILRTVILMSALSASCTTKGVTQPLVSQKGILRPADRAVGPKGSSFQDGTPSEKNRTQLWPFATSHCSPDLTSSLRPEQGVWRGRGEAPGGRSPSWVSGVETLMSLGPLTCKLGSHSFT